MSKTALALCVFALIAVVNAALPSFNSLMQGGWDVTVAKLAEAELSFNNVQSMYEYVTLHNIVLEKVKTKNSKITYALFCDASCYIASAFPITLLIISYRKFYFFDVFSHIQSNPTSSRITPPLLFLVRLFSTVLNPVLLKRRSLFASILLATAKTKALRTL